MEMDKFAFPRNLTAASAVVTNNMQQLYLILFGVLVGIYPLVVPADLRYSKQQLHESAVSRCRSGKGLAPLEFSYYLIFSIWLFTFQLPKSFILYGLFFILSGWVAPWKEAGLALEFCGKWIKILGNTREQLQNIAPYYEDLLPIAPKLLPYTVTMLENVEQLGPIVPKIMEEKKYMLPVLPELCAKLDVLLPIMDDIIPVLHKVAPHIELLLPKIEIMAPHIKSLIPLWDELEPRLHILVENVENLAPYLDDTVPYIDRLIPVLDLLPLVHESGVLQYDVACKALPITAKLLPSGEGIQRKFLSKFSHSIAELHVKGQEYLKQNETKMLPWISKLSKKTV